MTTTNPITGKPAGAKNYPPKGHFSQKAGSQTTDEDFRAAGTIPFGRVVIQATAKDQVQLPATAPTDGSYIPGISMASAYAGAGSLAENPTSYKVNDKVQLGVQGFIAVECSGAGTFTVGQTPHFLSSTTASTAGTLASSGGKKLKGAIVKRIFKASTANANGVIEIQVLEQLTSDS